MLALSVGLADSQHAGLSQHNGVQLGFDHYGYFDPNKCYRYVYNAATPSDSYFTPDSTTTDRTCTTTATAARWSGNYLNWASTQTLDTFRWALTGGHRVVDTTSETIIEKTRHSGQGARMTIFPDKVVSSGIDGAAPFGAGVSPWSRVVSRVRGLGTAMYFSSGQELSCSIQTNTNRRTTFTCNAGSVGGSSGVTSASCNTGN